MDKPSPRADAISKKHISKHVFRLRPLLLLLLVLLLSVVVIYREHFIVTDLLLFLVPESSSSPSSSSSSSSSSKKKKKQGHNQQQEEEELPQQQQQQQQQKQQQQLPPALRVSNFTGCCGTEGLSTFRQTCLTESACRNSTSYNPWFPYSDQAEADYLQRTAEPKRRSLLDLQNRKRCQDLADTRIPKYDWCREEGRKKPPYPYNCGRYSSGGKSGPYDRTYLFPKGNLLFCGIPVSI